MGVALTNLYSYAIIYTNYTCPCYATVYEILVLRLVTQVYS